NVIAREGKQGTSAMIRENGQMGAILIKACKPQQDRALDLPTIGPETVLLCAQKNMKGIIGEAGKTLIVEQDRVKQIADEKGLFVFGAAP
ncbi:MAG: UDP-2,3-diacylglucosamine diphosphatase LpxI, partial [Pseudomonadota bacterium]